jgi:hypothetical protein
MKRIAFIAISALVELAVALPADAQTCSFLNLPSDVRSFSLGGASIASPASALNPAGTLFSKDNASLGVSYIAWLPSSSDVKAMNLGGYLNLSDRISLSAGGTIAVHRQMTLFDDFGFSDGTFRPIESSYRLGASFKLGGAVALYAAAKIVSSSMGAESKGFAFAGDVLAVYRKGSLSAAAGVLNVGSRMSYGNGSYNLPMRICGGAEYVYALDDHVLTGTCETGFIPAQSEVAKGAFYVGCGIDYTYAGVASARIGYHYDTSNACYCSLGLGIRLFGVGLDAFYLVAGRSSSIFGTFGLGLSYSF